MKRIIIMNVIEYSIAGNTQSQYTYTYIIIIIHKPLESNFNFIDD